MLLRRLYRCISTKSKQRWLMASMREPIHTPEQARVDTRIFLYMHTRFMLTCSHAHHTISFPRLLGHTRWAVD